MEDNGLNVQECAERRIRALASLIRYSVEELLPLCSHQIYYEDDDDIKHDYENKSKFEKIQAWEGKALHGQYVRETKHIKADILYEWLSNLKTGV